MLAKGLSLYILKEGALLSKQESTVNYTGNGMYPQSMMHPVLDAARGIAPGCTRRLHILLHHPREEKDMKRTETELRHL